MTAGHYISDPLPGSGEFFNRYPLAKRRYTITDMDVDPNDPKDDYKKISVTVEW